jgi:hypothetical protein
MLLSLVNRMLEHWNAAGREECQRVLNAWRRDQNDWQGIISILPWGHDGARGCSADSQGLRAVAWTTGRPSCITTTSGKEVSFWTPTDQISTALRCTCRYYRFIYTTNYSFRAVFFLPLLRTGLPLPSWSARPCSCNSVIKGTEGWNVSSMVEWKKRRELTCLLLHSSSWLCRHRCPALKGNQTNSWNEK